jgi:DNA-binding HxlR family transcriptional regulator
MKRKHGYGQFCPVAKAAEIVAERWTPLVLRELICGSRRFNELRRGVPLMSPSLLAQRLRELEDAGVVERRAGERGAREYHLTPAGAELGPIIESLGTWGARWAQSRLTSSDYDPGLLMWDIRRNIDLDKLAGPDRLVVQFDLRDTSARTGRWWLVIDSGDVDLCLKDPGHPVDLFVLAPVRALTAVWMGQTSMRAALASGALEIVGPRKLAERFSRSLRLSAFAGR